MSKVKIPWYQGIFCCGSKQKKINKSTITASGSQIITYDELCKSDPAQMERSQDLYFNKKYSYYCDKQKRMLTKNHLSELKISDFQPTEQEQRQVIKYSCPICFRYFNNILQASCCQNYICQLCCMDYIKKNQLKICHFCQCENSYYMDVVETDKLKIYSDSQGLNFFKDMKIESQVAIKTEKITKRSQSVQPEQ